MHISLKTRVMLLIAIPFVVVAALAGHQLASIYKANRDSASSKLAATVQGLINEQNRVFDRVQDILVALSMHPDIRALAPSDECNRVLAEYYRRESSLNVILVSRINQPSICNAIAMDKPVNVSDRDFFEGAVRNRGFTVGDYVISRTNNKPAIGMAQPIFDDAGRPKGVVSAGLSLTWFNHHLAKHPLPPGAQVTIVDGKGIVIARHPEDEVRIGTPLPESELSRVLNASQAPGTIETVGIDGEEKFIAYAPFRQTSAGMSRIWVSYPAADVLAPARRATLLAFSILLVTLAAVFGITWAWGNRYLLRPIRSLTVAASSLAAGDSSARAHAQHTDGDLANLARAFDTMAEALESKERHLVQSNRALRVISAGNRTLVTAKHEPQLLEEMCRAIVEAGSYRMAWIGYMQPDKTVRPVATWGADAQRFLDKVHFTTADVAADDTPAAAAIRSGIPVPARDVTGGGWSDQWRAAALASGFRACLALPLHVQDTTIGVLEIYAPQQNEFGSEETRLLAESSTDLSFGIATLRAEATRTALESRAQESEDLFGAAFENAPIGMALVRLNGQWLRVNRSVCAMLGYAAGEMLATTFADITHPDDLEADLAQVRRLLNGETSGYQMEKRYIHKQGHIVWAHLSVSLVRDRQQKPLYFISQLQDITGRRENERALERANRALRTLSATNTALIHGTEEAGLLDTVCRIIVDAGYPFAWIGVREGNGDLVPKAWAGIDAPAIVDLIREWKASPCDADPADQALKSCKLHIAHSGMARDGADLINCWPDSLRDRGYQACLAYPLELPRGIVGVLNIYAREAEAFDPDEIGLLSELGADVSFGIVALHTRAERDRIAFEHEHHAEILKTSLIQSLQAIATTVELRDPYTAGHSRRVAQLATAIGREMGMDEDRLQGLRLGSAVHDLGKIKIPAEILSNPNVLTDVEYEFIKVHPAAGYSILKDVKFPWPIAEMVWQHHERLDGSGYPRQLKGDDIILEARVMAVADVVEAMASHRPYRAALGIEAALSEIAADAGVRLDADAVAACIRLFRDKGFVLEEYLPFFSHARPA